MKFLKANSDGVVLTVEFPVSASDTVASVRHKIYEYFWKTQGININSIRFSYNGIVLDMNTALLGLVNSQDASIDCELTGDRDEIEFMIYHVLEQGSEITVTCLLLDSVLTLKKKVSDKIIRDMEDFELFYNFNWMKETDNLYQFDFADNHVINYCDFQKFHNRDKLKHHQKKGAHSEIYQIPGMTVKMYVYKNEDSALKPLIRELIALKKVGDEARIVRFLGFYRDGDSFFIGMEDMPGGSLKEYIEKNGALTESLIRKWANQILEGLKILHDNKIIFRNLKTSNILLDAHGDIKLSGLSLSRYFTGHTNEALKRGIPQSKLNPNRYMSPEAFNEEKYGVPADLWSFGAVVLEMATGKPPYSDMTGIQAGMKIAKDKQITYTAPEGMSDELKRLISECLEPNPVERATLENLEINKFLTDQSV